MARRLLALALVALIAFGVGLSFGRSGRELPPSGGEAPTPRAEAPAPSPSAPPSAAPSATAASADVLTGRVAMIDGDTLNLDGTRVRLFGVDAPETRQPCRDARGALWDCGEWVASRAHELWDGRPGRCEVEDTDRYGRKVARCSVAGQDLGAALVSQGMALAYLDYSRDYLPQQQAAQAAKAGVWAGTLQAPWDWRRKPDLDVTNVVVLSAPGCEIKGNISSGGKLYHLPGSRNYARTTIDESQGERWFCTEAEAQAAGWRKAG